MLVLRWVSVFPHVSRSMLMLLSDADPSGELERRLRLGEGVHEKELVMDKAAAGRFLLRYTLRSLLSLTPFASLSFLFSSPLGACLLLAISLPLLLAPSPSPSLTSCLSRSSPFSSTSQVCVRRRAILSVAANPNCPSREAAEKAVNEVWESCWSDTRPFDEVSPRASFLRREENADRERGADLLSC